MKIMMRIQMLSLFFTVNAYALVVQAPPGSGALSCVDVGGTAASSAECCPELAFDTVQKKCSLPARPNMIFCSTDPQNPTNCPMENGKKQGCYPVREEDYFPDPADSSPLPESPNDEARLSDGDVCETHSQCESLVCEPNPQNNNVKECREKLICRLAEVGEELIAGTGCEEDSEPKLDPSDNRVYCEQMNTDVLAYGTPENQLIQSNQCSYEISADMRSKRVAAMKGLRAFEFVFSSAGDDKTKSIEFLKGKLSKPFFEDHKKLLTNFNIELNKIEAEEKLLREASRSSERMVTINGETLKEKEVALRRASGKDAIRLLWRRNLLSMSHEQATYALVTIASQKMKAFSDTISKWKGKKKKWTLPEVGEVTSGKKLKKSWMTRHRVKPKTSGGNAAGIQAPGVQEYLSLIGGSLPKKKFYLLDIPLPAGSSPFGTAGNLQNNLAGSTDSDGLNGMRLSLREKVKSFYGSLKGVSAPTNFSFEPEVIPLAAKNCVEQPNNAGCDQFIKYTEEIADTAFAQMIAYSAHKKGKYKKFFEKENTLRRRMFKQLAVDLQNLTKYYEELNRNRIAQNECFIRSFNYIATEMGDTNINNQVNTDTQGTTTSGAAAGSVGSSSLQAGAITQLGGQAGQTNGSGNVNLLDAEDTRLNTPNLLGVPSLSSISTGVAGSSGSSGGGSSNSEGTSLSASAIAANAITRRGLINENGLIKARNRTSASEREAQIKEAYASVGGGSAATSDSSSSNAGALSSQFKGLDAEIASLKNEITDPSISGAKNGSSAAPVIQESFSSEAAKVDTTSTKSALSDEDTEVMMANLERSRSQYEGKEEDELFSRVSKAYVRNMDKILKKKKID